MNERGKNINKKKEKNIQSSSLRIIVLFSLALISSVLVAGINLGISWLMQQMF